MKLKNKIIFLLIFNILVQYIFQIFIPYKIFANNEKSDDLNILSRHVICIERSTESVLYEKDAYTKCAMASTTKIMSTQKILSNIKGIITIHQKLKVI